LVWHRSSRKRGFAVGVEHPHSKIYGTDADLQDNGKGRCGIKKLVGKEKRPVDFTGFSFPHWEAGRFPNLP